MIKVSIIIPIFNVENYLRECLNSVRKQTLKEIEIICVNDGSTDHSLKIVQEFAKKDKRVVVITGENGGYGKAMNRGFEYATGSYIGIVEPDDYIAPNMFDELYQVAVKYKLDLVKSDFYRFTRTSSGKERQQYVFLDRSKTRYGELLNPSQDPSTIRFQLNTWTGIYRREFIETYHIRHNETAGASFQDNGFFFQTFVYAKRAMIVQKAYYKNRRDNPNSSVKSKEKVYCMNIEYDFIRNFLMEDKKRWETFRYMYWWKKYHCYMFTFSRIAQRYKKEYLRRMGREYKRAMQKGELDPSVFSELEWKKIHTLIQNIEGYYYILRYSRVVEKVLPYIPRSVKNMILKLIARR